MERGMEGGKTEIREIKERKMRVREEMDGKGSEREGREGHEEKKIRGKSLEVKDRKV